MIQRKTDASDSCAVCERTLLLGERSTRFSPGGDVWVDVCPLCTEEAMVRGWLREGSPSAPIVSEARRRRRRLPHIGLPHIGSHGRQPSEPEATTEPVLRRLTGPEQAMVDAAEHFNRSPFCRTVAGIAKSLGEPRVSLLPLSGTNPEVVITIAWEISWYQYRVAFGSNQPVRLADRGYELEDLDERFERWNGTLDPSGSVAPDIPRF